jgi:hypothetical protein
MTLTEIRETLTAVSDAVPVPAPDALAFQRAVRRARRRRATVGTAAAAAAVLVVVGGTAALRSIGPASEPEATDAAPAVPSAAVPVLLGNHVRVLSGDGVLGPELLGPDGPDMGSVVGTTPEGIVVLTAGGTLGRINAAERRLDPLVSGVVRSAYLDGDDAVVYDDERGVVRFRGIAPVQPRDSAQTDQGRLVTGGRNSFVLADEPEGDLVAHDARGLHPLDLDGHVTTVVGGDISGGVVAIRTEDGAQFFELDGTHLADLEGLPIGSLSPEGDAYAQVATSRDAVHVVDPRTGDTAATVDLSGDRVEQVGWSTDGDLLVVVTGALWRCSGTSDCRVVLTDADGTLRVH